MIDTQRTIAPAYQAALQGAALAEEHEAGRIFMRGRDRAALLQRLSTADVERLRPGQGTRTVLTTPIGRIVDLLTVHALEDALLLVTSVGQGGAVWSHLKKNIFFQDQVTMEAGGRTHAQLALFGPAAASVLQEALGANVGDLPRYHTRQIGAAGAPILVAGHEPIGGPSFTLYVPTEQLAGVRESLVAAGAAALDAATLDILRIEQGYPAFGRELSLEYIPLETGLHDAVSFTKGCYVGQEIIARMESRGRLAKMLRGLKLATAEQEGAGVERLAAALPVKLDVNGKEAGDLTSLVYSPRFGPIALAYVRAAHAEPGSVVGIAGSDVRGEVIELPFAMAEG